MNKIKSDHGLPECIARWGWKYHHMGIPTNERKGNERYYPELKAHFVEFDTNPFGIEWMRFDEDNDSQEVIRKNAHIAFEVQNLDRELANRGFHVISPPCPTSDGIRDAIIEYNGALVQLIEYRKDR